MVGEALPCHVVELAQMDQGEEEGCGSVVAEPAFTA